MQWVWWFILAAGCSEWMVTLTNRIHGLPVRERSLKHVRHLLELGVIIVPWLVFLGLLIHSQELMTALLSEDDPRSTWWVLNFTGLQGWITGFGLTGFMGLIVSSWRYHFCSVPATQVLHHRTTVDVSEKRGDVPIATGPYHWMTRFPFNEIFQVEVAEKHFHLRRLPHEWAGLSIVHLSDMHFIGTIEQGYFETVCELAQELQPDMFVFTGDLLDNPELTTWLPSTLGRLKAPLGCWYILGNHDWNLDVSPIRAAMNQLGWNDIAGRTQTIVYREKELLVGGTERPWMGDHPEFGDENPAPFRLLLSHTPDNLAWARQHRIDLMLAGHNHGGQVVLPLIGPVYSPSLHGVRYAGGVFDVAPTLLHVSRGLSGRYPLRWRCRPEVTKLVLHSEKMR
ncbi:MAG: metallophosphoesterase [Planctomycetota bacterium]|nr:metallophosphoesterase [Planctomycetota bacterium]MDA1214545.1 metallophosphoesterase [Planctomycetota bacterium]